MNIMIFAVIPNRYPITTMISKPRLFPSVVLLLSDLAILSGHEQPNKTSIIVSHNTAVPIILKSPPLFP